MKCPKKKNCIAYVQKFAKKDYICCGFNQHPKKYRHDVIKLCLKGKYVKDFGLEMTPAEALDIISCISSALANIAQS